MKKNTLICLLIMVFNFSNLLSAPTPDVLNTLNNTGKCIGCTLDGLQASQLKAGLVITDLSNSSIQNANLPGINLTGANLTNSKWLGTNLTGANLSNANLTNIILGNETYIGNQLAPGANLTNANLSNVTMSQSFISQCNLTNTLISTKILDGYFDGSTFGPCTMIVAANANNSMMENVALQGNIYIQTANGLQVGNSTANGQPLTLNNAQPVISITSPNCSNFANLATIQASLGIGPVATLNSTGKCIGCTLDGLQLSQLKAGLVITDLSNSSIQNANLPGINLTGANLTNSKWLGTNLTGANLSNTNLTNVILGNETYIGNQLAPGANLTNANLSNVTMSKSFISQCNLTNTLISTKTIDGYFDGSTFGPCTMIVAANANDSMMENVALQGNIYIQTANGLQVSNSTANGQPLTLNSTPPAVNITNPSCSNFNSLINVIQAAGITLTPLENLNFTGKCVGCKLDGLQASQLKAGLVITDLSNSSIQNANLTGINLTGANLTGANFTNTVLTSVNLSNTTLNNTILTGATLNKCNFTKANINKTIFDGLNLSQSVFFSTIFEDVSFKGTNLSQTQLSGIILNSSSTGNNFTNDFTGANLAAAYLISANVVNTKLDQIQQAGSGMLVLYAAHSNNVSLQGVNLVDNIYIENIPNLNLANSIYNGAKLNTAFPLYYANQTTGSAYTGFYNLVSPQLEQAYISTLNNTGICQNCNLDNLQMSSLKAGLQITSLDGSSLKGANLTGINLSNVNSLNNVDFSGANLTNANFNNPNGLTITNGSFNGANLTGAQMQNVSITGTDFTGANLTGAVLSSSAIANAKFDNAIFGSAKVGTACTTFITASMAGGSLNTTLHGNVLIAGTGASAVATNNIAYAALTKANSTTPLVVHECLTDAAYCQIATNPILPTYTIVDSNIENISGCYTNTADPFTNALNQLNTTGKCPNCTLVGMSIDDINLSPGVTITSFNGADLSGVDFSNQNLTGIDFTGANLSGTNLTGVTANGVNFTNASLYDANLSNGNFNGANFTGAGLGGAILTGATFVGASFANLIESMNSNFTYTNSNNQLVTKAANTYIDLRGNQTLAGINFSQAYMVGVNLSGSNLTNTNFTGANLTNTVITSANVTSTNFTNSNLTGANCTGIDFSNSTIDYNTTIFTGANLTNATFKNQINGANFANATSIGIKIPQLPAGTYNNVNFNWPINISTNTNGFTSYTFNNCTFTSTANTPININLNALVGYGAIANFSGCTLNGVNMSAQQGWGNAAQSVPTFTNNTCNNCTIKYIGFGTITNSKFNSCTITGSAFPIDSSSNACSYGTDPANSGQFNTAPNAFGPNGKCNGDNWGACTEYSTFPNCDPNCRDYC